MDDELIERIVAIIDAVDDMTIATVREDGFPQATTVSYANDGLAIYFGTSDASQKAQNIARSNKVSMTINAPYEDWSEILGLSIGGLARKVTGAGEIDLAGGLLFDKFPQISDYVLPGSGEVTLYRIDPVAIALLDYSQGFGHTEYVTF